MIVCPSIAPRSMAEARKQLREYASTCRLLEIRLDTIPDLDVRKLLASRRPPLIATFRHQREGGSFHGPVDRQSALLSVAQSCGSEYIDVEYRMGGAVIDKFIKSGARIILSYHNFRETPSDLEKIYHDLKRFKPAVIKIAVTALDIADNIKIFRLLGRARADGQKMIALCMGERGEISRILTGKFGGFLSFAAESAERNTGPGQVPLGIMTDVYHAHKINPRTKIFGLLGNPVRQSKGMYYHNDIFYRKRKNAVYCNFPVEDLTSFFRSFETLLTGGSVTMPLKGSIIPWLDRIDRVASELSSVNTIVRRRGTWYGCNTDYPALLRILSKRIRLKGKRALIIGTGAMARTMAHAISSERGQPLIMGRSLPKTRSLARSLNCQYVPPGEYTGLDVDVVMNATPVGMLGYTQDPIVPPHFFRRSMIVLDVVNRQDLTPFLSVAKKRGCTIISGYELFQEQAKLQSDIFLSALSS